MLIASRVLQGLFGAALIPQGFGIIKAIFPPRELTAAFGAFGPAIGLAAVAGPILAGALIAWDLFGAGWRTIFLINVPIGLACLALALVFVPESRSAVANRLDLVGMLLVTVGLVLMIYPLVQGRDAGWPAWMFGCLLAALPVLGAFAAYELRLPRRGRWPLVEPALFASRAFTGGLVVGLIFFAGMVGLVLIVGLYLQIGLGYTPLAAGLTQAPWSLGTAIGAALSGAVLGRRFGRPVLQVGALLMAAGIVGMVITLHLANGPVTPWQLAPALGLSGLGMGLLIAPFFDITLAGVSLPMVGSASGVLNANQQLGSAAGVAVLGTVFFQVLGTGDPTGAVVLVLWIVVALLALTATLAFLLPRRARPADAELGAGSVAPAVA